MEGTRLLSVMTALGFCLSAVQGMLATSSSDWTATGGRESLNGNRSIPVAMLALTAHDPIFIDGNSGFTNSSGVVWGSGTGSNPYIIEGWDINASAANGIEIRNTDAHFIVRGCHVYDGEWDYDGVHLWYCANGTLDGNDFSDNYRGIYLFSSTSNTLNDNNCSYNGLGIWLHASDENTIANNTCTHCSSGVVLRWSAANTLSRNNCSSNNNCGLELYDMSADNTLSNNSCSSNGYCGVWLYGSSLSNILDSNRCFDNRFGIFLDTSSDNTLVTNNCSNNTGRGIWFDSSVHNVLNGNICDSNSDSGIALDESSDNSLNNNLCSNNDVAIILNRASGCALIGNIMIGGGIGLYGGSLSEYASISIDASNTVDGKPICYLKDQNGTTTPSGAAQIIMVNCTNMVVENQDFADTYFGLEICYSSDSIVRDNTCLDNSYGIIVDSSSGIAITNNTCTDCIGGMALGWSTDNVLSNNNCSSNDICGIELDWSAHNSLSNNNCGSNGFSGVGLFGSSFNTLRHNTCLSNRMGMYLYDSDGNTLENNTFSLNHESGMAIWYSSDNNATRNDIGNNVGYGVCIYYGSHNRIWNNTLLYNHGATDAYSLAHIQGCDNGLDNQWNNTEGYGNYWGDWTSPDSNMDGIVDMPYSISGSAGAKDYYPLMTTSTEPIPEFGMIPFAVMVLLMAIVMTMGARRRKK